MGADDGCIVDVAPEYWTHGILLTKVGCIGKELSEGFAFLLWNATVSVCPQSNCIILYPEVSRIFLHSMKEKCVSITVGLRFTSGSILAICAGFYLLIFYAGAWNCLGMKCAILPILRMLAT